MEQILNRSVQEMGSDRKKVDKIGSRVEPDQIYIV